MAVPTSQHTRHRKLLLLISIAVIFIALLYAFSRTSRVRFAGASNYDELVLRHEEFTIPSPTREIAHWLEEMWVLRDAAKKIVESNPHEFVLRLSSDKNNLVYSAAVAVILAPSDSVKVVPECGSILISQLKAINEEKTVRAILFALKMIRYDGPAEPLCEILSATSEFRYKLDVLGILSNNVNTACDICEIIERLERDPMAYDARILRYYWEKHFCGRAPGEVDLE